MRSSLVAVALGALLPAAIAAQEATLSGRIVHRASGAGVPGAEVRLVPGNTQAVTDAAGDFRFDRVAAGTVSLLVRRLGFSPESVAFIVQPSDNLDIVVKLQESAQPLDTVTVAGRERPLERGKLAGFYQRKRAGIGRFFEGDSLEKQQNIQLADIISRRTPGVRLVRSRVANSAFIATGRRSANTFLGARPSITKFDQDSGADTRACYADVYLDGIPVYKFGNTPPSPLFDVNALPNGTVAAVELYIGLSEIPVQYNKTGSLCGVMLIWTK